MGCTDCNSRKTPGFIEKNTPYSLAHSSVESTLNNNFFCTCATGQRLELRCKELLGTDPELINEIKKRSSMRRAIQYNFNDSRGFEIPPSFQRLGLIEWKMKFGRNPTHSDFLKALSNHEKSNRVETGAGQWSGIFTFGKAGTGKTGGLTALLAYYIQKGEPCLWLTLQDMLNMCKWDEPEIIKKRMRLISQVPYLMIDEFIHPGEKITDHERDRIIFPIIDRRYQSDLTTLCTSNSTHSDIKSKVGEATWDRLLTLCAFIHCGGSSVRTQVTNAYAAPAN